MKIRPSAKLEAFVKSIVMRSLIRENFPMLFMMQRDIANSRMTTRTSPMITATYSLHEGAGMSRK